MVNLALPPLIYIRMNDFIPDASQFSAFSRYRDDNRKSVHSGTTRASFIVVSANTSIRFLRHDFR